MLGLFTGITVLCTARKGWRNELFSRVDDIIYRVTGHRTHIVVVDNPYHYNCICADQDEYVLQFDVSCDVSSDLEKGRQRCHLLMKLIKGIVDEKLCVEVCLDGTELLVVNESN